jgi:hypothetical protein
LKNSISTLEHFNSLTPSLSLSLIPHLSPLASAKNKF